MAVGDGLEGFVRVRQFVVGGLGIPFLPGGFEEGCWYVLWVGVLHAGATDEEDEEDEPEDAGDGCYDGLGRRYDLFVMRRRGVNERLSLRVLGCCWRFVCL